MSAHRNILVGISESRKSRKRLVNFRLNDDEYQLMLTNCRQRGATSVSEFARDAILTLFDSSDERDRTFARRLVDLEGRLIQIESRLGLLEPSSGDCP